MTKMHFSDSAMSLLFLPTDDAPTDFWSTHLFKCVEVHDTDGAAFSGRGFLCRCERGQFVHFQSSSLDTRITEDWLCGKTSDAYFTICLLHAGECVIEEPDDASARFGANELFALDGGWPMRVQWNDPCVSYLKFPRSSIIQMLGWDPGCARRLAVSLHDVRLAPFLAAGLTLLGTHGPTLSSSELDYVLADAIDLSCALLQVAFSVCAPHIPRPRDDRLKAAYRYIEQNLHQQGLTPDKIAHAIHCSRTQLYRLFKSEQVSVMDALREARLKRGLAYLEQSDRTISIGEVAHACGFPDQSTFGKLFRRRFGKTPGEVQRAAACRVAPSDRSPRRDALAGDVDGED
ncbi:helix-turn-helix domain-containing protein [Burkholderia pyrrocinia]